MNAAGREDQTDPHGGSTRELRWGTPGGRKQAMRRTAHPCAPPRRTTGARRGDLGRFVRWGDTVGPGHPRPRIQGTNCGVRLRYFRYPSPNVSTISRSSTRIFTRM